MLATRISLSEAQTVTSKVCVIINCMFLFISLVNLLSDVRWRRATARWKAMDLYFPTRCRTPLTDKYTRTSDMKHSSSTLAQLQIEKFSMAENIIFLIISHGFPIQFYRKRQIVSSFRSSFLSCKNFRFAVELKLNSYVSCQKFARTYPLEACGSALESRGPQLSNAPSHASNGHWKVFFRAR